MSGQKPQSAGKVAVTCPHCGFKQLESPYVKSTFCRKCGEHYDMESAKPRTEGPTLLARVGKLLIPHKTREVTCFDCGALQTVSSSSTSSLCPQCSAYIDLSNFKIDAAFSRMVQTQGTVTIGPKADVTSSRVACREVYIYGRLRGNVFCTGTAHIRYKGKITGGLEAQQIIVEKQSEVEFTRPLRADSVEIYGKAAAHLQVKGKLFIDKRAVLEGNVEAKSIVVEKGGRFSGDLAIGQETETPPRPETELPPAEEQRGE